jgi:hypothetical protein
MSDVGLPPVRPRPKPGGSQSEIPMWVVLIAILVMLAMAATAAFVLLRDADAKAGPTYPAQWDARIKPYAKIVERKRGLLFRHPVAVRFLAPAAFEKSIAADKKELSKDDRKEIDQFTAQMRAVGLLSGNVDLFDAVSEFNSGGTLAYYSFADQRITIRGQQLTPTVRATLVHELTHALQDQHFAIGEKKKQLSKESDKGPSTSESTLLDAVVEGDAERVATLYGQSLGKKQRRALDRSRRAETTTAMKRIRQVPKYIVTIMTAPYTLGETLVQAVAADGGNKAVDKLFRTVPRHETALLDPFRVMGGRQTNATKTAMPTLAEGEKKFDSGEFGVLTWYLMLAERLPLKDALAAADGWGGDAYVAFERKGTSCARMAYDGRTPQDTTRMFRALQRWSTAGTSRTARVSFDGATLIFESCDPGTTAKGGNNASEKAVTLVLARSQIGLTVLKAGVPKKRARCVAGKFVQAFTLPQLTDPKFGVGDPAVQARIVRLASSCR